MGSEREELLTRMGIPNQSREYKPSPRSGSVGPEVREENPSGVNGFCVLRQGVLVLTGVVIKLGFSPGGSHSFAPLSIHWTSAPSRVGSLF